MTNPEATSDQLLTVQEAAKRFKVCDASIRKLAKAGHITAYRISDPPSRIKVDPAEIIEYMRSRNAA